MLRTREHRILSQKEKDTTREIVARLQAHVSRVPLCLFLFTSVFSFDHSIVRKRTILISCSRATSRKLGATLFLPSGSFPFFSLSLLAEISIRVVTRMRNERPFILSASPIRARIERGARESIRRKPQIVNILERARTKLAAGKCGAPKLRLCVRRARCTRTHIFHRSRAYSRSQRGIFLLFAHASALLFILSCFVPSFFRSLFLRFLLAQPSEPSPIITYTTLFLSVSVSSCLPLPFYSHLLFFLRVVYSRTCQRISIFMKGLQCSLVRLFALDMHVLSRAILSRAPFVRSLSLFLCLVRYYSFFVLLVIYALSCVY